jgi:tetratricopeptide (TPR) repeat protein
MLTFLRRPLYVLSNKIRRNNPEKITEEKWVADFSKSENSPFDIKSESSYNAYQSRGSLTLGLKKKNCIAWVETPEHEYQDQIIEAKIRLDSMGGYAAAGLMFRIIDDGTYYLALVSSKGYFRLDVVRNSAPQPLIGWTEVPGFDAHTNTICIIAYGAGLVFLINGRWAAETSDDTVSSGRLGFALASYDSEDNTEDRPALAETAEPEYTCRAWLESLSVDSRIGTVEEQFRKWENSAEISAESRLHLAETFAALGNAAKALDQITRAWARREEAARSVTATYTEMRSRKELLLACRMAFALEQYAEAGEYIDACIEQGTGNAEGKEALAEKARILGELQKHEALRDFMAENSEKIEMNASLYALLARSCRKLDEYEPAAAAWDSAFELDKENGVFAANAAEAWELAGNKEEALKRLLEAGRLFMRQDNRRELAALVPKLVILGAQNHEARALAGKWAFSVEDYDRAEMEFAAAEDIRRAQKPKPAPDPAVSYLRGLILSIKEKYRQANRFFEEAVCLAPDYGLFRFKLAENRVLLAEGAYYPGLAQDLESAVNLAGGDTAESSAELANQAGALLLKTGDFENAGVFFDKALAAFPDNVIYLSNQVSCLMALGLYDEAGELLTHARLRQPSPALSELIAQVSAGQNPFFGNQALPVKRIAAAVKKPAAPPKTAVTRKPAAKKEKAAAKKETAAKTERTVKTGRTVTVKTNKAAATKKEAAIKAGKAAAPKPKTAAKKQSSAPKSAAAAKKEIAVKAGKPAAAKKAVVAEKAAPAKKKPSPKTEQTASTSKRGPLKQTAKKK